MVRRVCLVSGGTGGHLMPALALARALRASGRDAMVLTEGRPAEKALLAGSDVRARELAVGGGFGLPVQLARATLASRKLLREEGVDLVIGTGGRASVPVAVAARSLGVPVCLMEQNAVPGRANRWLARLAKRVWLGLPAVRPLARSLVTGTPLRAELGQKSRARAREELGLAVDLPLLLVFGGSQGAAVLNEVVPRAVAALRRPLQMFHLAGIDRDDAVRRAYADGPVEVRAIVRPIAKDMATLYAAADLVVCRGGGSTVAELIAAGRPAIIVPYPHHQDRQQYHNGRVLERSGAGLLLDQAQFDPPTLAEHLRILLDDPRALARMGECARGLVPDDACARILADLAALEASPS